MISDKLISVVIATYNMGQFLPMAVRSVLEQTYPNVEVHVVDDGSTDYTKEAMNELVEDPRVKYHYQPNRGQASAKNRGIFESKGEYIAFLDADDLWMPKKLEKQMPIFNKSKTVGVVYSRFTYIDDKGTILATPNFNLYRGRITGRLLVENFVPFNTTVVRRECFEKVGKFNEALPMGIDYDLWLRISEKYDFDYVDEPTIFYRVWSGQMSRNYWGRYKWAIKIMMDFLERNSNLVDEETIKEAWAHTYTGRGDCILNFEKNKVKAFRDYLRALKHKTTYLPAWKGIAKLFLR